MSKKKMTNKELVDKLEAIRDHQEKYRGVMLAEYFNFDPEEDHMNADQLLLDYIDDPEVTQVFYDIKKWYA